MLIILSIAAVVFIVSLVFGPGSPSNNYANSHVRVDERVFCGPYYEDVTVADKFQKIIVKEDRMGLIVLGTDEIERETGQQLYDYVVKGARYHVVSQDLYCGRWGHHVIILGISSQGGN